MCGMPAEFQGQFCAVDRIAEIVSGAIRHECNKICVWAFARGAHRVEHVTDAVNDLKVGALGVAADVISLSHPARFKHALNSGTMILYMEPVTDVLEPVPYTGSVLRASALSVTSGISFSGN